MLQCGVWKPELPRDASPFKVDSPCLTCLYFNGPAQQPGQHFGAHFAVQPPAFPGRRVVVARILSSEFNDFSSREGIPDPLFRIRETSRTSHANIMP